MRAAHVTPAIVLRCWPFGESDRIVSFLTAEYGKVTGIAKGAKRSRRRFVNSLEPFSLVQLSFQDRPQRSLAFIHTCELLRPLKYLTTSLERIAYAFYIVEIADVLAGEREENRPLFEHLKEGLIWLEERGPSQSFLAFFELKLLRLVGYQPGLESCRRCGSARARASRGIWRFSVRDGGILCASCSTFRKESIPLSAETLDALVDMQKATAFLAHHLLFPSSALKQGRSVLLRFIEYQSSKELKSAPFLDVTSLA